MGSAPTTRNEARERSWRRTVWSEEDLQILRTYYAQGRAGALRAVKELRARHPDWRSKVIWRKAKKLGISTRGLGHHRCGESRLGPWRDDPNAYTVAEPVRAS